MTRRNREWRTIRIDAAVIAPLDNLVRTVKDEFGMPVFKNKSDAIAEALKEFLKKHSEEGRNQAHNSQHSAGAS